MKKRAEKKAKKKFKCNPVIGLLMFIAILVLICAVYFVIMDKSACITGRNNVIGRIVDMFMCRL